MQEFVDRYNAGASLQDIADDMKCSVPTARKRVAGAGANIRGKGRRKGSKTKTVTLDTINKSECVDIRGKEIKIEEYVRVLSTEFTIVPGYFSEAYNARVIGIDSTLKGVVLTLKDENGATRSVYSGQVRRRSKPNSLKAVNMLFGSKDDLRNVSKVRRVRRKA